MLSCLLCFLLAAAYEGLKMLREIFDEKSSSATTHSSPPRPSSSNEGFANKRRLENGEETEICGGDGGSVISNRTIFDFRTCMPFTVFALFLQKIFLLITLFFDLPSLVLAPRVLVVPPPPGAVRLLLLADAGGDDDELVAVRVGGGGDGGRAPGRREVEVGKEGLETVDD